MEGTGRGPVGRQMVYRLIFYGALLLLLGIYAALARDVWQALLKGSPLPTAGFRSAIANAIQGGVLLGLIYLSTGKDPHEWLWRRVPGPLFGLWGVVIAAYLLPLPAALGIQSAGAMAFFLLISVILLLPLNTSNYSHPLYWTSVVWRSFALYHWAQRWLSYALTAEWSVSEPADLGRALVGLGVVAFNLVFLYLLEYRVDWERVQREVEARASSASA